MSWALSILPDPGPKPTVDPHEYDAYSKAGTSVITGHVALPASFGRGLVCIGGTVVRYPRDRQVSAAFHDEYGQVIVQTPNGEYPENYVTKMTGGFRYDDGYVVTFDGELDVKAGQHYSLADDSIRAVEHDHPRKGQL